jgi:hypothetical protein
MWKEEVVAYFKVLFQNSPEENYEKPGINVRVRAEI